MLNIKKLSQRPQAFRRLCGLTPGQFTNLVSQLEPRWELAQYQRQAWLGRQRTIGGGRTPKLALDQSLFMPLLYYRTYANHLFMGLLMGLDDSNVGRYFKRLEPVPASFNRQHARARIIIEHLFAHLKQFRILQDRYRNPVSRYNLTFRNVCGLRNLAAAPT